MKVTIYPYSINKGDIRVNPYISDFIHALQQNGITIANPPHKNPLFSLIPRKADSDAYIFHWPENVPDYKYGMLQTLAAIWLLFKIKCHHKKIIWFLHNKQPHVMKHRWSKKLLIHLLLRKADLIVTHATEGIKVVQNQYPKAVAKTVFLHHPTKNRIEEYIPQPPETDLLIWGNISRYKGVPEFVRFATQHSLKLKTKIIGKCSSQELLEELRKESNEMISIEDRSIPFEELKQEIRRSRFVLVPYAAESILSSGILMDSLSFGAKVIGPAVGSFRDYATEPLLNVYTFHTFDDIQDLVGKANEATDIAGYNRFLNAHSWNEFGKKFQKFTSENNTVMKVLYTFGGMPHYLNAMLNKLHNKGVEITVITPQKGNATIGKGVKMVEGGTYRHLTAIEKKAFYGKSSYPSLPEIVREEKPDILIMGWPYFLQVFFQPRLRKAMKECRTRLVIREIPFQTPPYGKIKEYFHENPMYDENMRLVSTGTGFYLKQWLTAKIRKYCYARITGTLNYSTAAYDILPSYGVKQEQIHVTYNSTDTDALLKEKEAVLTSPPLLPPSSKRALHIGRLVKWKRVDLLIDAFTKVIASHPDAELVVVGDGPELDNLKKQAADLNLTEQVRFIGAVYSPKELGAYMNESTVYVLAGMGGLSINDAMTYGLPVVCSVCDSTERDLVTDGVNGLFFKEGNADSLSDKLNKLFASPERCASMGRESERIVREKINIETVSERYLQAFRTFMQ